MAIIRFAFLMAISSATQAFTPEEPQRQTSPSFPIFEEAGDTLRSHGISPRLVYWSQLLTNPTTGPRKHEYGLSNNLLVGADFDLEKIAGISGAKFNLEYIAFPWRQNLGDDRENIFNATGSFLAADISNDVSSGYLSQFSYEQHFMDDRLQVILGRFSAATYFNYDGHEECTIITACHDVVWKNSSGTLPPPYGSWSAFTRFNFTDSLYMKAGYFQSDFTQYATQGHGFNWSFSNSSGENISVELGYKETFEQAAYPAHYWLTGYINNNDQVDPRSGLVDGDSAEGMMFNFRKAVWRADGGKSQDPYPESLTLYGTLSANPEPNQPFDYFAEAGASYLGPFGRRHDIASVSLDYARVGERHLQAQRAARVALGGADASASRDTYAVKLRYLASLPRGAFIEPMITYAINPDNQYNTSASRADDGIVFRLVFGINLGTFLGLSPER
ncbi:carbohydrate porin [Pseudomonas putida]|nr:carbohydrate porin [Pseudomonas putida]